MQDTLRHEQQQDGLPGPAREGRFGRVPPTDDAPVADARTEMEPGGEQERGETVRYEVDPDAVARAILERLVAGRTLPRRREERR